MVFRSVQDSDEDADDAISISTVGQRISVRIGEEATGEIADSGNDDRQVVATIPKAIVGSLIAKDLVDCEWWYASSGGEYCYSCWKYQHQTHDNGKARDLNGSCQPRSILRALDIYNTGRQSQILDLLIQTDDETGECGMQKHWNYYRPMYCAFDEPEDKPKEIQWWI